MPTILSGDSESSRLRGGFGKRSSQRVEIARAIASKDGSFGLEVLHSKTERIKFNR